MTGPRLVPLPQRSTIATLPVLATVFLCGGVLLGVEMAASRVLAPFFGNSLFVWAAIIGVILGGLAAGYWLGGALADRYPSPLTLAGVIGAGAVTVLAIPLVDSIVIEAVLAWDPGARLDPILCTAILFLPMAVLLSAVGPIAVRLQTQALQRVGRTAGRTFAISTAGSIAGTFATAFWLIPELGVEQLFVLGAAALFATAAFVGLASSRYAVVGVACALSVAAGVYAMSLGSQHIEPLTATSAQNWSPLYRTRGYGYLDARDPRAVVPVDGLKVRFAEDTRYHRLAVVDDADSRYLRFDNSLQSAMYLDDPFRTRYRYTDFFHLGIAYNPDARDVLFVGLGAGSSEKRMWRDFPELRIQAVELDPVVVDVAYEWFELP
ncbi:MAG TPA: fused MFS/spermidine synthase, partial [Gaiellaceae bacterium]|nr:fused MFS/spermidine synthase [Gaiellaceae bacterium]